MERQHPQVLRPGYPGVRVRVLNQLGDIQNRWRVGNVLNILVGIHRVHHIHRSRAYHGVLRGDDHRYVHKPDSADITLSGYSYGGPDAAGYLLVHQLLLSGL